jgi:hypothetical protein
MRRFLLAALVATLPLPAIAADRTVSVTTFSRVRIEGPFVVQVATGASPSARVSGDPDVIERIDVAQNGETLIVRVGGPGWGERPSARAKRPVTIVLGTPRLDGVAVGGEADVHAGAMKGPRVDLTVTGAGKLAVERVDADQLVTTVVGSGVITADAGKVTAMRAMVNGAGAVTAPELSAGDLIARVEGPGEVTAAARFTAQVTATGLGKVVVLGTPKCQVRAPAGAAVTCGR